MMFRPASASLEENRERWENSVFYTKKDFLEEYKKHAIAMQHIAECAKIFIQENWEKIQDWSGLNVTIRDNTGESTEYYNYKHSNVNSKFATFFKLIDEKNRKKHNPIIDIKNVVLDPTDGDFSLTVNGKDHLWIDNESVIVIANFIERKLNGNI